MKIRVTLFALALSLGLTLLVSTQAADITLDFANPPQAFKTRPLWFWNGSFETYDINEITSQIQNSHDQSAYGGFGILSAFGEAHYMRLDYLNYYGQALDMMNQLGMKASLYDEYWFPTGSAGGQLADAFPQHVSKRLDKTEADIIGPRTYQTTIGEGTLMAVVAMENTTNQRIDLTDLVTNGSLTWSVPAGSWKIMVFRTVTDGSQGIVDYLDPEAVRALIQLSQARYYYKFPDHFGSTIEMTFYDEPTFWLVQGARAWTDQFNQKFEAAHGYDPRIYYPALWYDIGPDTAAARNALFGFRATLYANGLPKETNDWAVNHGLPLGATGHIFIEEPINPVGHSGDLMKAFKHQAIPGIDRIGFGDDLIEKVYKVVSSSAYNYDKDLVMSETYGNMNPSVEGLYRIAIEQYAKGVNLLIPHAIWYDTSEVTFPPELSYRDTTYGPALANFNDYIARLNLLLQDGRHVADIAVLYPMATLQAGYFFDGGDIFWGEPTPPEADYMDVGATLSEAAKLDFTFIHPEVLDETISVDGAVLNLNNTRNYEQYRVLIIPGSKTIAWSNLQKIKQFYDQGGVIISTKQLPFYATEFGHNTDVENTIQALFGQNPQNPTIPAPANYSLQTNANGGKAYFSLSHTHLPEILNDALAVYDVETISGFAGLDYSYLHKVRGDTHIYFFANYSQDAKSGVVQIKGHFNPQLWNPHTGGITTPTFTPTIAHNENVTHIQLALPPANAQFVLDGTPPAPTLPTPQPVSLPPAPTGRYNAAWAKNGAVALSSSTQPSGYHEFTAINGNRRGTSWAAGGGWNDNTPDIFSDTLEIGFAGPKTINEINIFTLQDDFENPVEPTLDMTFNQFGITDFAVEYWDNDAWQTIPGGLVSDNNKIWRQFTFAPITTTGIRVQVYNALNQYSRIVEVEAWTYFPALSLTKQANTAFITVDDPLTYTITLTNTGSVPLNTIITDTLPNNITLTNSADGVVLSATTASSGGQIVWPPVAIAPGEVWSRQVALTVNPIVSGTVSISRTDPIINQIVATTQEGVTGMDTATTYIASNKLYLPVILR
ncbi:MAG: glycosyl hydrolase [Chloroflexota bacterium]